LSINYDAKMRYVVFRQTLDNPRELSIFSEADFAYTEARIGRESLPLRGTREEE